MPNALLSLKEKFTAEWVTLIAKATPPCHRITQLLSLSLDHPLPARKRFLIKVHFLICVWCRRYGRQLQLLRKYGRALAEDPPLDQRLSPEARQRLHRCFEAELKPAGCKVRNPLSD
jgi:hypothetical protein